MVFSCPAKPYPPPPVKLISFHIVTPLGVPIGTYQAEAGMTFDEWVSSSYNTDGYDWRYGLPFPYPAPLLSKDGTSYIAHARISDGPVRGADVIKDEQQYNRKTN